MAEVTNTRPYAVPDALRRALALACDSRGRATEIRGTRNPAASLLRPGHPDAVSHDVDNRHAARARQDERLARIERRLVLADAH